VLLPAALLLTALWLGLRESRLFLCRKELDADVFVYTRRRLIRRLVGLAALGGVGVSLFLWLRPGGIRTQDDLALFGATLATLVAVLVAVPVLDVRETAHWCKRSLPRRPPAEE
jgi:hypothetical protein